MAPEVTEVETHGVEPIPDAHRAARPLDLFRIGFGASGRHGPRFIPAGPPAHTPSTSLGQKPSDTEEVTA